MKTKNVFSLLLAGLAVCFTACDEETKSEDVYINSLDNFNVADTGVKPTVAQMEAVVANFVDQVAIPTHAELEKQMTIFNSAVLKFVTSGTQNDLEDACEAWRNTRQPWEEAEAFLFGPADLKHFDPSLDSWPLDANGIDQILQTGNWDAIGGDVNEDESAVNPPQNLRGFHTAEYLLFSEGDARKATECTANEKEYLKRVVARMLNDVKNLHKGWTEGLGDSEIPSAYGEAMKKHDNSYGLGSVYVSIETILNDNNGMAAIAGEVGTAKIADPVDKWNSGDKEGGVLAVESWYSWNSLTDYEGNIISIKNCYLGGRDGVYNEAGSLSALVKIVNPELDKLIRKQIEDTIDAIQGIPAPFRSHLDASTEIKKAQNACASLNKGLGLVRNKLSAE